MCVCLQLFSILNSFSPKVFFIFSCENLLILIINTVDFVLRNVLILILIDINRIKSWTKRTLNLAVTNSKMSMRIIFFPEFRCRKLRQRIIYKHVLYTTNFDVFLKSFHSAFPWIFLWFFSDDLTIKKRFF